MQFVNEQQEQQQQQQFCVGKKVVSCVTRLAHFVGPRDHRIPCNSHFSKIVDATGSQGGVVAAYDLVLFLLLLLLCCAWKTHEKIKTSYHIISYSCF